MRRFSPPLSTVDAPMYAHIFLLSYPTKLFFTQSQKYFLLKKRQPRVFKRQVELKRKEKKSSNVPPQCANNEPISIKKYIKISIYPTLQKCSTRPNHNPLFYQDNFQDSDMPFLYLIYPIRLQI